MYEFQSYDPAKPKMVTSFKGNQKLIFEGYRYNIHHVVEAKNVKTWRCVCAKKLTSARSWCKGRAETWDSDTQGISKGEHNHPPEHEVAELEYFKSQLILAAIAHPNALLNDLIDEAANYMSDGVSFGSRESLKKSLTVARKSAENGGFKLKCYKNSDVNAKNNTNNNNNQRQQTRQSEIKMPEKLKDLVDLKMFESNGTMFSLFSLAQQQRQLQQQQQNIIETNNNNTSKNNNKNNNAAAAAAALIFNNNLNCSSSTINPSQNDSNIENNHISNVTSTASILNQLVTTNANSHGITSPFAGTSNANAADFLLNSGFDLMMNESNVPHFGKMRRLDTNAIAKLRMGSCGSSPASSSFNDSGLGVSPPSAQTNSRGKRKNAVSANFDAIQQIHNLQNSDAFLNGRNTALTNVNNNIQNLMQQQQKKTARVNNFVNRLSTKAAAAASSSTPFSTFTLPLNNNNCGSGSSQRNSPFSTASSGGGFEDAISRSGSTIMFPSGGPIVLSPQKQLVSIETQTDDSDFIQVNETYVSSKPENFFEDGGIRLNACIGGGFDNLAENGARCECRVIKVCCCSEQTCHRHKRLFSNGNIGQLSTSIENKKNGVSLFDESSVKKLPVGADHETELNILKDNKNEKLILGLKKEPINE